MFHAIVLQSYPPAPSPDPYSFRASAAASAFAWSAANNFPNGGGGSNIRTNAFNYPNWRSKEVCFKKQGKWTALKWNSPITITAAITNILKKRMQEGKNVQSLRKEQKYDVFDAVWFAGLYPMSRWQCLLPLSTVNLLRSNWCAWHPILSELTNRINFSQQGSAGWSFSLVMSTNSGSALNKFKNVPTASALSSRI